MAYAKNPNCMEDKELATLKGSHHTTSTREETAFEHHHMLMKYSFFLIFGLKKINHTTEMEQLLESKANRFPPPPIHPFKHIGKSCRGMEGDI